MTIDDVLQNAKRISIDDYFNIFDFYWPKLKYKFCKVESLQEYNVNGDNDALNAFLAKDYVNLKKFFNEFKNEVIKDNVFLKEKVKNTRLRYVKEPLSTYLSFEAYTYHISKEFGQEIRVSTDDELLRFGDFVAFDDECICFLRFNNFFELDCAYVLKKDFDKQNTIKKVLDWYDKMFEKSILSTNYFDLDASLLNIID